MWDHPAVVVSLVGLIVNMLVTIVGGVWKLSRLELGLRTAIIEASDKTDEKIERQGRYFGESVAAVRAKITEVELYARDTFVRRSELKAELKGDLEHLSAHIDGHLERIEAQLLKTRGP